MAVIGAGLDLGAGRRGVDMGPSAIRYAGLDERIAELGRRCEDWGDVETAVAEATAVGDERMRYLAEIKATCERIAALVARARTSATLPLVLGGDHSVALGTLGGHGSRTRPRRRALARRARRPEPARDVAERERPRDAARGRARPRRAGVRERRVPAAGRRAASGSRWSASARSTRASEALLAELRRAVFTMSDLDRMGVETAMREALEHVAGDGFVHLSLDMDVLDPEVAPGVGTPVRGGLSYREAHLAMELIAESGLMSSLEVVEVNPILDRENQTAKLAVELVASALGARIL